MSEVCVLGAGECPRPAVVAVRDLRDEQRWGCEEHAAAALDRVDGARLGKVADWDACNRLLLLPWNRR